MDHTPACKNLQAVPGQASANVTSARQAAAIFRDRMSSSQNAQERVLAARTIRYECRNAAVGDDPLLFTNQDVVNARERYSAYLKKELDDEIVPHWRLWDEALQACSAIATVTFDKEQFVDEYRKRRSSENEESPDEALRLLYEFSVLGYERRSGYGGSSWAFRYTSPEAGWDTAASRFKVHLGLKEYAKLREERGREE